MNRYQGQYQEMRNYFDEIRAQVEVKPYEEVELRTIMSSLNKAGMDRAGEHISYPMLQRKDIFQSTKNLRSRISPAISRSRAARAVSSGGAWAR